MKFRWKKGKRFTFVIVPDANGSIFRLTLSETAVFLLPILFLSVLCAALACYVLYLKSAQNEHRLSEQLALQKADYQTMITDKNETIEQLEREIARLSMQAEEVRDKLEALKNLERQINGGSQEGNKEQGLPVAAASQHVSAGGLFLPLKEKELLEAAKQAQWQFSGLSDEADLLTDKLEDALRKIEEQRALERVTPSLWPTRNRLVTSDFGYRIDPFTRRYSFHNGIDIQGRVNDPVYSTADGIVEQAGWDPAKGNHIVLNHTRGIRTVYMHLNKILVQKGEQVKKGQKIGLIGSTGRSTGPHLHYEIVRYGTSVNPRTFLNEIRRGEDEERVFQKN